MNEEKHLKEIVRYWIDKALTSLDSAYDDLKSDRLSFSVNRIYYACFYAASAVLLQKGFRFKKHSGVRAALHKYLVKAGIVSRNHGQFYDVIFEARQRGDYIELVHFEKEQVEAWLKKARHFVEEVKKLDN